MLTLDAILRTQKQMSAYGEGRHRLGIGCEVAPKSESIIPEKTPPGQDDKKL